MRVFTAVSGGRTNLEISNVGALIARAISIGRRIGEREPVSQVELIQSSTQVFAIK